MAAKFQMLRGLEANLPAQLLPGQLALTTDSFKIFMGSEAGAPVQLTDVHYGAVAPAETHKLWVDETAGTIKRYKDGAWAEVLGFIESDINATPAQNKVYSTQAIRDILVDFVTVAEFEETVNALGAKDAELQGKIDQTNAQVEANVQAQATKDASQDARMTTIEGSVTSETNRAIAKEAELQAAIDALEENTSQAGVDNTAALATKIDKAEKGQANGVATLDENGLVPVAQLPAVAKEMKVVATIAERDAITEKFEGLHVLVKDATADPSVQAGAATYIFDGTAFVKVSEAESMDVVQKFANLTDVTVSVSELNESVQYVEDKKAVIDDTIAKAHVHANKSTLDQLVVTESTKGKFVKIGANGNLEFVDTIDAGTF